MQVRGSRHPGEDSRGMATSALRTSHHPQNPESTEVTEFSSVNNEWLNSIPGVSNGRPSKQHVYGKQEWKNHCEIKCGSRDVAPGC